MSGRLFKANNKPNWCPGCGDYGLLSATTKALGNLGEKPHETVIVSGIGCSSSFPHWTTAYGIHMVHGRALPAAMGVNMVNPKLKMVVVGGDGDGYGIGVGHFVHASRRNLNMTYMVMNNQIYGLTLGQSSPSSQTGHVTLTTPEGVDERPVNPINLSLAAGATFVARAFTGDSKHLLMIIEKALQHDGFAFIDVLSPCVTFNKLNTYDWFRERVYKLEEGGHDASNISLAFEKGLEWGSKIPIGVFYQGSYPTLDKTDVVVSNKIPVDEKLGIDSFKVSKEEIFNEFR
jgi:2-oxoglutarate ferredoxin oxidoreductase subunit beta